MRLVVDKYAQLFKFLFDKYTAHQRRQSSDFMNEKTIRVTELIKMYRDHNIDHSMFSKQEVQILSKQINNELLVKYSTEALTYNGFVQMIV